MSFWSKGKLNSGRIGEGELEKKINQAIFIGNSTTTYTCVNSICYTTVGIGGGGSGGSIYMANTVSGGLSSDPAMRITGGLQVDGQLTVGKPRERWINMITLVVLNVSKNKADNRVVLEKRLSIVSDASNSYDKTLLLLKHAEAINAALKKYNEDNNLDLTLDDVFIEVRFNESHKMKEKEEEND